MKAWSSKSVIPGDAEVPYEKWKPEGIFGDVVSTSRVKRLDPRNLKPPEPEVVEPEEPAMQAAEPEPEVEADPVPQGPSPEEIEAVLSAAREQGMAEGRASGWAAGHEEGLAAGREQGIREGRVQAESELARMQTLLASLATSITQAESELAGPLLDVALAVARQVLRRELTLRRDTLIMVIREALTELPQLAGQPKLLVNPDDLALVETLLGAELAIDQWRIVPDSSLEPGGARIESSTGEVDLSVEARWRRVVESLGRSDDWSPALAMAEQ